MSALAIATPSRRLLGPLVRLGSLLLAVVLLAPGEPASSAPQRAVPTATIATPFAQAVEPGAPCGADELCLAAGRYAAGASWRNPHDNSRGTATPVAFSELSGFFSFADPGNPELMLKVLDLDAGPHLFWTQLTDFELELTVREVASGETTQYRNSPDRCGGIEQPGAATAGSLLIAKKTRSAKRPANQPTANACIPAPDRLCLAGGRFALDLDWSNPYDQSRGTGNARPLSEHAGTFSFDDPRNLELLVKVLDFGPRILVFWGSLSDFGYTLRVTDTSDGNVRSFTNPPGRYCGGQDADAFGAPTVALVGVDVLPLDRRDAPHRLLDQTILLRGDRIAAIGPRRDVVVPAGATVLAGEGRLALPGLIDMHVHLRTSELAAYPAHGITTVRNMWGWPGLPALAAQIHSGQRLGPTVISASNGVDGDPPPPWPYPELITNPALAAPLVDRLADSGWRYLKVYQNLSSPVYDELVAAARRRGLQVVGHVSNRISIQHALAARQYTVEHFSGYVRELSRRGGAETTMWTDIDHGRIPGIALATRDAGTWNCPTMAIYDELARRNLSAADVTRMRQNRGALLRALDEVGAPLLVGTDAGIDVTAAGSSLVDELSQFVAAGLSPFTALRAATHDAARNLGELSEIGTLEVGKRADLILVEGDPLEDVAVLRRPSLVVLRGVPLPD